MKAYPYPLPKGRELEPIPPSFNKAQDKKGKGNSAANCTPSWKGGDRGGWESFKSQYP